MNFNCIPNGTERRPRGLAFLPGQYDAHVKDYFAGKRRAAFADASDAMMEGIKRCGSVAAWMREVAQRDDEARAVLNGIASTPSLIAAE